MREIMWYLLSIRRKRNNKITVVKAKPRLTNGGRGFISVPFSITNKEKNYESNEITFEGVRIVCACNYRNYLQYDNYCAACIDLLHRSVSVEFHNERT